VNGKLAVLLMTAYAPISWGTTYVVTTEWLPPDRPLLAGTIRALPAGLVLLAVSRQLPSGAWWWKATVLGVVNVGALFAFLFVAAERLPGGVATSVGSLAPLIVAGVSWPLLGLRPALKTLLAGLVGAAGVGLVVLTPQAAFDAVGVAAAFGSTFLFALGAVLTKLWGRPVSLVAFTGWQLTAGGLMLLPILLPVEGLPSHVSGAAIGGFAYMTFANTALAYALWFRGIERLPVDAVAFLALLGPITAVLLGYVVLDQTLSALQIGGIVLAGAGLVTGQIAIARQQTRRQAAARALLARPALEPD
jgi:probable blue pigment (indigoidine) exporter